MFRKILERPSTLDSFEDDYITLNIDQDSTHDSDGIFLLYIEEDIVEGDAKKKVNRDFLITGESLNEITKKFPKTGNRPSVLYEGIRIKILRKVYPQIIGVYLKPMDTNCLEAEF